MKQDVLNNNQDKKRIMTVSNHESRTVALFSYFFVRDMLGCYVIINAVKTRMVAIELYLVHLTEKRKVLWTQQDLNYKLFPFLQILNY